MLAKSHDSDITVLYVGADKEDPRDIFQPIDGDLKVNEIRHRMLFRHGPVVEAIVDEAEKGYDLVMIGATERPAYYQYITGSTADSLIRKLPCPVVMVKTLKSFEES